MLATNLIYGRVLTGGTLAIHFIFSTMLIGLPLFLCIAEFLAIRRKDQDLFELARRWSTALVILFAVGTATGIIVAAELSVVWPRFMVAGGNLVALPLLIEVIAFIIEGLFIALYVGLYHHGWGKSNNPYYHWALSLPMVAGSAGSGYLIVSVNAFMNTPSGFRIVNGKLTHINPVAAMFTPSFNVEILHVLAAAYAGSGFILSAVLAYSLLRGSRLPYFHKALRITLPVAGVAVMASAITGDMAGKLLARLQPEKLAAIEGLYRTSAPAALTIGGYPDYARAALHPTSLVVGGIRIPELLSWLSFGSVSHPVVGLAAFARTTWPPAVIHLSFDTMVLFGTFLILLALWYFWQRERMTDSRLGGWLLVAAGPIAMGASELGWMTDEVGRVPWIVYNIIPLKAAITRAPLLPFLTYVVFALLLTIGGLTAWFLMRTFRQMPLDAAGRGNRLSSPGANRQPPQALKPRLRGDRA